MIKAVVTNGVIVPRDPLPETWREGTEVTVEKFPGDTAAEQNNHPTNAWMDEVEAIALEAYRERKLTTAQLRRILGFETRYQLDGFLKQHEVWLDYTWKELERDRETHRQLGL